MVGSRTELKWKAGAITELRCVSPSEALELGQEHDTISYPLGILRHMRGYPTEEKFQELQVRVGKQSVDIEESGCLDGEENITHHEVDVVTYCPTEKEKRCAGCIMNLTKGEEILKSMEGVLFFMNSNLDF